MDIKLKKYLVIAIVSCMALLSVSLIRANQAPLSGGELLNEAERRMHNPESSPVRRIDRDPNKHKQKKEKKFFYRNIDGSNNNIQNPDMNEADTQLIRITKVDYSDGISALAGTARPSPSTISNIVLAQSESIVTNKLASDMLWQWGQFLDHDIDLTDGADPAEPEDIPIPKGDPVFDRKSLGNEVMAFNRSIYDIYIVALAQKTHANKLMKSQVGSTHLTCMEQIKHVQQHYASWMEPGA